ncbi:MAG: LPS export ABC transporter ATP-binding protein [Alphaproteobacteria bacterium]|nr:LPS export ABC transporter ATP-binding protein [Alphaproteobacteria bacterium]
MLEVASVAKAIDGTIIVHDVSLCVRPGETVGLLGPNGAGKTTTFRLLTGMLKADQGQIRLDDEDISHLEFFQRAQKGIGFLPQESLILRSLTVDQNFETILEVQEASSSARRQRIDQLLELFNIVHLRKTKAVRLSGGERRRCEIALVLACRPRYVLLDEPFAGIDPIAVGDLRASIGQIAQLGAGVLITDHYARELLSLVDRAYVIYAGRVLSSGDPDALMQDEDVRKVYLGEQFRL